MQIGILQTGHSPDALRPETGDYHHLFERLLGGQGFTFRTWSVVDMDFPDGPEAAEGWLITGSRHGAYEDLPFIDPLMALLRDIVAAERPVVGICFGHQILARALGGRVEKYPGGWVAGRQVYDWNGRELALHAWHQDQVITPPEGAETIATGPDCAHAALLYPGRAFTVQPHPEFEQGFVEGLIAHRGAALPPDRLSAAAGSLGAPVQNTELAAMLGRFLKERRL